MMTKLTLRALRWLIMWWIDQLLESCRQTENTCSLNGSLTPLTIYSFYQLVHTSQAKPRLLISHRSLTMSKKVMYHQDRRKSTNSRERTILKRTQTKKKRFLIMSQSLRKPHLLQQRHPYKFQRRNPKLRNSFSRNQQRLSSPRLRQSQRRKLW